MKLLATALLAVLVGCGGQSEVPQETAPVVVAAPPEPPPPPPEPPAAKEELPVESPGQTGWATNKGVPYDKAFPPQQGSPPLRIGIMGSPSRPDDGLWVALLLGNYQRGRLEKELGREVKIAFVSRSQIEHRNRSLVHYRKGNLKAAGAVAAVMPKGQVVEPMTPAETGREGVDVLIYVGTGLR